MGEACLGPVQGQETELFHGLGHLCTSSPFSEKRLHTRALRLWGWKQNPLGGTHMFGFFAGAVGAYAVYRLMQHRRYGGGHRWGGFGRSGGFGPRMFLR